MMIISSELHYVLAFCRIRGLGLQALQQSLELVPTLTDLFKQKGPALIAAGFSPEQAQAILNPAWQVIEAEIAWGQQPKQHILTWFDDAYPEQLKHIANAPPILYVQGELDVLQEIQIAIVGSRNPSSQGLALAERFAFQLAEHHFVVTSGLALGIDGASHRGALAAKGKTIAVLGTGLNIIYPSRHLDLAQRIMNQGALVSEFFLDTPALAANFPRRNRIISGLTKGVLVVEAALRSGSLITARYAAEQGREVFAIPGSIHNPLAKGCHHLIRQGAKIAESLNDVIEEILPQLDLQRNKPNIINNSENQNFQTTTCFRLDEEQAHLLKCISFETLTVNEIVQMSGLSASKVMPHLLELELAGFVKTTPGGYQLMTAFK